MAQLLAERMEGVAELREPSVLTTWNLARIQILRPARAAESRSAKVSRPNVYSSPPGRSDRSTPPSAAAQHAQRNRSVHRTKYGATLAGCTPAGGPLAYYVPAVCTEGDHCLNPPPASATDSQQKPDRLFSAIPSASLHTARAHQDAVGKSVEPHRLRDLCPCVAVPNGSKLMTP